MFQCSELEYMRPHDSRKMFAELVHSGRNDTISHQGRFQESDIL